MNVINTTICRWGNSRGVRLPKTLLDVLGLRDNDEVTLKLENDSIIIKKAVETRAQRAYPTLTERFAGYTGDFCPEEWDTGKAFGKEF